MSREHRKGDGAETLYRKISTPVRREQAGTGYIYDDGDARMVG